MKTYKESKYNIPIFTESEKVLIANSLHNSFVWLSKEEYALIKGRQNLAENELPARALKHHLVTEQETDETKDMLIDAYQKNHSIECETLWFVIAPTMSCNYKCVYCFEHNRDLLCNDFMSDKTIEDTVLFMKRVSKAFKGVKRFVIKWFGGEPLLHMDAIEKLVHKINRDFAREDGIALNQLIITNGLLLSEDYAKRLSELGIKRMQITIDGMPKTYAKMKGCRESDFYKVIENIKTATKYINVSVRMNVADYNKDEVRQLADYLDAQNIHVGFYTAWVQQYTEDATDTTSVNATEYNQIYKDTVCYVNDKKTNLYSNVKFPAHSTGCEACWEHHWCITPDGSLYCCEHLLGNEQYKIGSVTEGIYKDSKRDIWMKPNIPPKCLSCRLLPRCLINCITDRDVEHIPVNCDFLMENYKENIRLYAKYKEARN